MTVSRSCLLLTTALVATIGLSPVEAKGRGQRIVAVADIHGSFSGLVGILEAAGLIDQNLDWSGGDSILAQTGDFLDRGAEVRKVMDLLMKLEAQAPMQGGEVQVALGNHEVANLLTQFQLNWVTPEICATFSDESSAAAREAAFESWWSWRKRFPRLAPKTREHWMETFPLGFLEYQEALGPDGKYGKWLRGLSVVLRIQDTIFMHAGISKDYSHLSVKEINKRVRRELRTFDELKERLVKAELIFPFFSIYQISEAIGLRAQQLNADPQAGSAEERTLLYNSWKELQGMRWLSSEDGPLWYRGYTRLSDLELKRLFFDLKKKYQVERFVVGHTPVRPPTIQSRLGGRFFLIDTGMLRSHYHGRASALQIQDGAVSEIYPIKKDPSPTNAENSSTTTRSIKGRPGSV